jgi:hypothetical protein
MLRESTLNSKQKNLRRIILKLLLLCIIKSDIYDNPDQCDLCFIISQKLQSTNVLKTLETNI